MTTVCGSGARGFEDGAATVAKFADIRGIVFHPLEKALFVCDNGNRRVRKISLVSGISSSASPLLLSSPLLFSSPPLLSHPLPSGLVSTVCSKLNGRALAITSNNGSFFLFVATIDQIFKLTTTSKRGEREREREREGEGEGEGGQERRLERREEERNKS